MSVLSSDSGIAGSVTPDICDSDTNRNINPQLYYHIHHFLHKHCIFCLIISAKHTQCLCVDCEACSKAVGKAMCEVKALMDTLAEAESLYTSSKSMSIQHPIINSDKFINKVKV